MGKWTGVEVKVGPRMEDRREAEWTSPGKTNSSNGMSSKRILAKGLTTEHEATKAARAVLAASLRPRPPWLRERVA